MAPLDGDMLVAFRRAKETELARRRSNLSSLVDEIKISQQYNTAYIQLAANLSKAEKENLAELLNERLGGVYAYVDSKIDRLLIDIRPALLVRINKYAAANKLSRMDAVVELIELGLSSQGVQI